jgi:hypothetical protein
MTPSMEDSMTTAPRTRLGLLLLLAAGLVALSPVAHGQDQGSWSEHGGGVMVRGSGKPATEQRNVGAFQAIHLKSGMRLVVRQAAKEAVEVSADDNIVGLIETAVTDRAGIPTLEIGSRRGASYTTRTRAVVTIDVVTLKSLSISGSGDVVADNLKAGELKVKISGSGDVQLRQLAADALALSLDGSGDVGATGHAGKLAVSIQGSGGVAARDLQADDVSVSIAGSGDAHVHARKTLAVSIAGSGDVDYAGDPVVRTSVAGSGSVTKR